MKILSFFIPRGGRDILMFNCLLCSYLSYRKGRKVLAVDMGKPLYNLYGDRVRELALCRNVDSSTLYPIIRMDPGGEDIERFISSIPELSALYDYVVINFPSTFGSEDAICRLVKMGLLDGVGVPIGVDGVKAALAAFTYRTLLSLGLAPMLFLYGIQSDTPHSTLEELRQWFEKRDMKVSGSMIAGTYTSQTNTDCPLPIYSSTAYPTIPVGKLNPKLETLFEEFQNANL